MSKQAPRVARPASRYWRGKAAAVAESEEESEEDDGQQQVDARGNKKSGLTEEELAKREGMVIQKDITLVQTVKSELPPSDESSDEDENEEAEQQQARKPVYARPIDNALPPTTAVPVKEESEYETDSEEESSEEEAPAVPLYKPVFVSKRNRDPKAIDEANMTPEQLEEVELKRQAEMEEQRRQAHVLVAETIKRSLAEKEVKETFPDVDDTDGIDSAQEFEDWKLRELTRIKRDADAKYAREQEQEEVEARRALPEALRLKEDLAAAAAQREAAKAKRGQQGLLAKYHHRGAFYAEEDIVQRDTSGAVMENEVRDVASLPNVMQVRDYGKRSRTKHTHLNDVDTTNKDAGWSKMPRTGGDKHAAGSGPNFTNGGSDQGCFYCGGAGHMKRDCPVMAEEQSSRTKSRDSGYAPRKNAFGMDKDASRGDWAKHGDVRDESHLRRGRSRSRSPRRSRSRSRDRSIERMRRERDKRRRVD